VASSLNSIALNQSSLNPNRALIQEMLRIVYLDLHTLPGWKVAQIISARSALQTDRNPRADLLQLHTYRQANVYSRNLTNITRASRISQIPVQFFNSSCDSTPTGADHGCEKCESRPIDKRKKRKRHPAKDKHSAPSLVILRRSRLGGRAEEPVLRNEGNCSAALRVKRGAISLRA
jgi:hypothetical protein